jgi:hypothetical protein
VPCKTNGTKLLNLKIKLTEDARNLQQLIAAKLETLPDNIKVIANGKVLNLDASLESQGVKNNKQIMALVTEEKATAGTAEDPYVRIQKIRSEAELLLKDKSSGFLNIEDQSGKPIHLPENERRSIIMALLLYEKGRVQLKKENFSDALIMFLEADDELKLCNSKLVQSVDNVALLNLDIVWCYLNLKSIMQLPDAENRLKICEENFNRSYGENLSRVKSVKGSSENERTLFARLHLMQGILFFHQNRRHEAKVIIDVAEREIQELKVSEESVLLLIEMGYSRSEAVSGLRSSFNSVEGAVGKILDRRQKFAEARKAGKKERKVEKFLTAVGLTANPRSVSTLHEMGFPKELCAIALQKSNDNLDQALNLLQNNQNELKMELAKVIKPDAKLLEKLTLLGFDPQLAENVLKLNINDFTQALDALLEMQNGTDFPANLMSQLCDAASSSAGTSSAISSAADVAKKMLEKSLAEEAAFENLSNDMSHLDEDDEYLTITLDKEEALLAQYKSALGN